jgi:CBS domain-containing protein
MATAVQQLMSSPPVTCDADATLSEATLLMDGHQIGSVVVTAGPDVVGILTERDLLRAAAGRADPNREPVRQWMTADPTCSASTTRSGPRGQI